jgi:uncharacterized protein
MSSITVLKLNLEGQETWRYSGIELERGPDHILLKALYDREDTPFHEITLKTGDLFIETYYSDRWYNTFKIHDRDSQRLKGWYCNIGRPAVISQTQVSYVDLALDLLVYPDGRQYVLDVEEFEALRLSPHDRQAALHGLKELQECFSRKFEG